MSIYYKYAPDGTKIVVLSYVDHCIYWYTSEALGKWFVDALGNIVHVNFMVYSYWFMPIRISQMKYHSISVDQDSYSTSILAKCMDTFTVKTSKKFYKNTFPYYVIFTKDDSSNSSK